MDFSKYGVKHPTNCESCEYYEYDEYTENTTSRYLIKSYSENLQIKGEYKVTCNVTVYGKTQNETFKLTKTYTYD
jgi:stress response protein YsnF